MRIAELADLVGTTPRTVRYYHQLGLLPVPSERGGWRDYRLEHVAHLIRIRVLAEAGVPLERIGQPLSDADDAADGSSLIADLEAAADTADRQLTELQRRRDLVGALLARARSGLSVSPMPASMTSFYDRLEASASDDRTRAAVRRERDAAELASYRGELPPEAELLYSDQAPDADAASLAAFARHGEALEDAEIEDLARANIARIESRLGGSAREAARAVHPRTIHQVYDLMLSAAPGNERLARAMERHLIAAVQRWREDPDPQDGESEARPRHKRAPRD